jgi:hypothetical protein
MPLRGGRGELARNRAAGRSRFSLRHWQSGMNQVSRWTGFTKDYMHASATGH